MERAFQELPHWIFWADEVSAACHRVKGENSLTGANLELTAGNRRSKGHCCGHGPTVRQTSRKLENPD